MSELKKGKSRKIISENIKREIREGVPAKKAIIKATRQASKSKSKSSHK